MNPISTSTAMDQHSLDFIRQPVNDDMSILKTLLLNELSTGVSLIHKMVCYIMDSGGKRLRPLLVLLASHACGYTGKEEHYNLSIVIEFLHMATLLHDDVIDQPDRRRGVKTANQRWGSAASILVGDFLYSRTFQILAKHNNIKVMNVLAYATNQIAEGEVEQLMNQHNPDMTEEDYDKIIRRKTAQLFSAASEIASIISVDDLSVQRSMANFGLYIGMAYQIIDDILDYKPDSATGKSMGNDLSEGKMTLPLIYAKQRGTPVEKAAIDQAIRRQSVHHLDDIIDIIMHTEADQKASNRAKQYVDLALQQLPCLPDSRYKDSLKALAHFVLNRSH